MIVIHILILVCASFLMAFSGSLLVETLIRLAKAANWREFVVGFLIMAFVASIPNLFVGITAALKGIPELSFGDVVGGNVVNLTLGIALAGLVGGGLVAESRLVQSSAFFTISISVLPLLLVLDGELSRIDGVILLLTFFFYSFWLFSKEERFKKIYEGEKRESARYIIKNILLLIVGLGLLVLGARGVVKAALFFTRALHLPVGLIGILIVGLGNSLPELYFTFISARKNQGWLILGTLMGSIITPATLGLGVVAIISPIKISDFSPYILSGVFLILSGLAFFVFLRSGKKLTRKESLFLLVLYISFLLSEIFLR